MKIDEKDNFRGGLSFAKVLQVFKLFLPKYSKTLVRTSEFLHLTPTKLKDLKIKGLILDADECISYNEGKILDKNTRHIKELIKDGIKVVVFSNMQCSDRYDVFNGKVKILKNVEGKPAPEGFLKALKLLQLPKKQVAMVGDNYLTDGGCIPLGIHFIRVKPIRRSHETKYHKIIRAPDRYVRKFYDLISRLHDKFRKPAIKL